MIILIIIYKILLIPLHTHTDGFFFFLKDLASEADQSQLVSQDAAEISVDASSPKEGRSNEKGKDKEEKEKEKSKDPDKEKGKEKDADRKGENEKEKLKGLEGTNLDGLLQRLPGCVSRDLIDQLTVIISVFVLALYVFLLNVYFFNKDLIIGCGSFFR